MIDDYNKLVRDKIPEIIQKNGDIPKIKLLDDEEYFNALSQKLKEEVDEYLDNYSIDELADIMEVIHAIVRYKGLTIDELEHTRLKKCNECGGFDGKIYLVEVWRSYSK